MSFIREVIDIVSENEVVTARRSISKLVEEVKNFQYNVKTYIDDNYTNFLPNLNQNRMMLDEGTRMYAEIQNIRDSIDNETKKDVLTLNAELVQSIEDLEEVALGLKTTNKILHIDELFAAIDIAKENDEFIQVMAYTSEIKKLIDDEEDTIFRRLDCFDNIKTKYHIANETLLMDLKQIFDSLVQLQEKKFQKTKSVTIKISKDEDKLHETLVALITSKFNITKICDFLLENVFEPIITKPVSIQSDDEDMSFASLTLSYSLKPMGDNLRPNYRVVFDNIKTVFMCLGNMNISISEDVCIFGIFADRMKEKFLRMLRDNCLLESVPNTMDEMNESTLVSDLYEFNNFLCDMLFLDEQKDNELKEFADRIEILFKNRFCANLVDKAVEIMHHDLHDMMLISESNTAGGDSRDGDANSSEARFPQCMVSKSTLELVNLMEKVLRQSESSKDELTTRLMSTIPTIINRYLTEVPTVHAKLLLNIPQQTALFHNNCMYLAYWMTMNASKGMESLGNLVKSLHFCGSEHFVRQISNQREQLMQILKEFDIGKTTSELDPQTIKVIRQCLRQLDLLKNVWQTILPEQVYNKTMSNILNDFCAEIIRRVLAIEDIPSAVSTGLVEILDNIITRAPLVFQDELQVTVLVKSWTKLKQLKMILNASMAHITDQWSDGKGPLTLHYKAEEIKHLIRALFKNTDRRAKALATIT